MKRVVTVFLCAFLLLGMNACGSKKDFTKASGIFDELMKDETFKEQIVMNIDYKKDNDPNELLGKENQYISKLSWIDKRIESQSDNKYNGGSIEVFNNKKEADLRVYTYESYNKYMSETFTEAIYGKYALPMLADNKYIHQYENAIIVLNGQLNKEQADEMFSTFDNVLKDYEYEQVKEPYDARIKKLKEEQKSKYDKAIIEGKQVYDADLNKEADSFGEKITAIEVSLDETALADIESEISEFNVPFFKEKYDGWLTQISEIKVNIEKAKVLKAEQEAAEKAAALAAKERTFSAGLYTVDTDIPWGQYDIIAISGRGNLFVRGGLLRINEIMGVGDPDFYLSTYSNALLDKGQTIEIRGNLVLNFKPKEISGN